eukprot:INCI2735.1.p1 GENE.INCI2735.1~~INCI2735.1.p1  ORF type:complete len:216 (-),score=42.67 INCI2735.1:163-810(-)
MKLVSVLCAASVAVATAQHTSVGTLLCYTTSSTSPTLDSNFQDPALDSFLSLAGYSSYTAAISAVGQCTGDDNVAQNQNGDYTLSIAVSQSDIDTCLAQRRMLSSSNNGTTAAPIVTTEKTTGAESPTGAETTSDEETTIGDETTTRVETTTTAGSSNYPTYTENQLNQIIACECTNADVLTDGHCVLDPNILSGAQNVAVQLAAVASAALALFL